MSYQLWDLPSGNLIDEFDGESEALAVVRAYLAPDASAGAEVGLVVFGDDDRPLRSIVGDELHAFAFGSSPGETRRSA